MADAVTTQILNDGPRNVVMRFTNISDGTGEAAVVKVDVSALSGAPAGVKLLSAKGTTKGMGVSMFWDATADVPLWHFPADLDVHQNFEKFGGIINNAGAGKTGDIVFTTDGHTSGDSYDIVLEMVKKY